MSICKYCFVFIMILISLSLKAQKGKLVFYTKPSNGIIKIGMTRFNQEGKAYELDTGKYVIHAWAPSTKLVMDTILIQENRLTIFRKKLPYTKEYTDFKKQTSRYNRPLRVTIIYAAVTSTLFFANRFFLNDNFKKAEKNKANYEENISLEAINYFKDEYYSYKKKYELHRDINNALVITSAILVPASLIRIVYLHRKNRKPEYHEQPLLSNTAINLRTNYSNFFGLILTHNF